MSIIKFLLRPFAYKITFTDSTGREGKQEVDITSREAYGIWVHVNFVFLFSQIFKFYLNFTGFQTNILRLKKFEESIFSTF